MYSVGFFIILTHSSDYLWGITLGALSLLGMFKIYVNFPEIMVVHVCIRKSIFVLILIQVLYHFTLLYLNFLMQHK